MAGSWPVEAAEDLLDVDLSADYPGRPGVLQGVRFRIARGEIAGLVGESGSGKSTLALALLRLIELRGGAVRGSIRFDGRDLMECAPGEMRRVRGREIALVFQSPMSALNPALRIETQLREVWRAHSAEAWSGARPRIQEMMVRMGLPAGAAFLRRYPRQLSVGQAQRVAIAMAVMHGPKLLIADEPTSSLDPESRGGILELFERLNRELGISILYISHDLASVARLCHSAGVIEGGRLVDWGPTGAVLERRWGSVAQGHALHHNGQVSSSSKQTATLPQLPEAIRL
jgi:ABC-type glutathione transport system ATPase component